MFGRKGLAAVALSALLACGGMVRAADTTSTSDVSSANVSLATSNQPVMLQDQAGTAAVPAPTATAPPQPPTPLMAVLEKAGIGKTLEDWNMKVTGYVEGSWTFDANHPPGGLIAGRVFDVQEQSIILDQLDLAVVKSVDATQKKFDIGFNIEQVYGTDADFFHDNGLTTYSPSKIGLARHPKDQYDLEQAYLTFAVPVGNGLTLTAGKFVTLLGNEVINPSGNPFYSHSFMFGEIAFAQTGLLGAYSWTDSLSTTVGFTRGWDQALKDINGSLDLLGQVVYKSGNWNFIVNVSSGNQEPTGSGLDGWRTVIDPIISYQYSDNLKLSSELMYAWEPQVDAGGTAQWYGAALYAGYKLSDMFTLNARGEWLDSPDGFLPTAIGFSAGPNQFYELTLGVSITPFPNGWGEVVSGNYTSGLVIRPEVRCDYADHGTWTGDNTHDQLTAAIEAYYAF